MPAQLGSLCKILSALVAHKRFFSSMCSDVVVKGRGSSKSTGAVTAFEWLLTGMNDSMRAQLCGVREALRAVAALIWLLRGLVTNMNLEHGPLGEGLLALTTLPQAQLCDVCKYWLFCGCCVSIFNAVG